MNNTQIKINKIIEELSNYINEFVVKREDTLGLSIALVNDTRILWAEGFGYTDQNKSEKVTTETLFSSQSIGKCFTATAFLILANKGLINLDDSIREYFPEFSINTLYGNPADEIAKITSRRLLSHTAGFTHEAITGNNYDYTECTFDEHVQSIMKGWLKSPVGSEISYSNLGYDLTGYVMGLIRNKTFTEVMTEELFQPLEMTTATYNITLAQKKSFARGFDGKFAYPSVQIPMLGAGGIFISVLDAAKLISFHLRRGCNRGEQIIKQELFDEMYKPQFKHEKDFGYGFGLYSIEIKEGAKVYGHSGGGYGYQTIMIWIPDFKIGVAVLSNNMKHSRVGSIARKALDLMLKDILEVEKEYSKFEKLKR
ncbi:MAG: serine hydrolase domain-containing protein, partial [Candidatus Thorarchaeota archaeon]